MTLEDKINVIYNWVMAKKGEQQIDICDAYEPTYAELAEEVLTKIGMSRSLAGFRYIAWAAGVVADNEEALNNIVKGLYTDGAERFNITSKSFERGIRHALDSALRDNEHPAPEAVRIFGDGTSISNLSNKAFLATLAAEVKKRKRQHKFDI